MQYSLLFVAGLVAGVLAEDIASDMGPAAFLFPPDRAYSASLDNTAPCGSVAQVGNRTDFPLTGGFVGLVDQEEAYSVQIGISYSSNPLSNSDFEIIISADRIKDLYEGHTCVTVPNAPSNTTVGDVATFQVIYQAVWDDDTANQTFYACADVTYILDADFTENDYCFNATIGGDDDSTTTSTTTTASSASATSTSKTTSTSASTSATTTSDSSTSGSTSSSHKGISHGAIAGAVVGSVCGAALLAVLGFLLYRLGARHQRASLMRHHMNNMALGDMPKATGSQTSGA